MSTSVCEHVVLSASCHLYWIQNNNVCVCERVGGGGGELVGGLERACMRACVCVYIVIVKYFPCI